MRKCSVSADTGSISQSKSSGIVRSGTYAEHEDWTRADRTTPVCMRSYSSSSSNAAGRKERER